MSPRFNKAVLVITAALLTTGCAGVRLPVASDTAGVAQETRLPRRYDDALALMKSGDYPAAIPVLRDFIADYPELAGPQLNLGIAYRMTGQDEAAAEALQRALKLNPLSPAAWHQQAILYRNQGDFHAALEAYNKAIELDQGYALAHRNIGILYDLYLQQPGPALQHYRKYLSLIDSEDIMVSRWITDLERRSGNAQARATP